MRTSILSPGSICQSVISGSLTLRDTNIRDFGVKFIFQNFEWSLSCSVFSQQLKTQNEKSERPNLQ